MTETWLDIEEFPGYQVSSFGNCKGPNGALKPHMHPSGYYYIQVGGNSGKRIAMHRLVCLVFHKDTYFEGAKALHKNSVRSDCHKDNLYWGTDQDNANDRHAIGHTNAARGSNHGRAKLTWEQVRELRKRREAGESIPRLAKAFGIGVGTCGSIIYRQTWKE